MKKPVQILVLLFIPSLLLSFIGVVLAASPLLPGQYQDNSQPVVGPTPTLTWLQAAQELPELEIGNSALLEPVPINKLVYFTATVKPGPASETPHSYVWLLGNDVVLEGTSTMSHAYTITGGHRIDVIGLNANRNPVAYGASTVFVAVDIRKTYLPLGLMQADLATPDLVCDKIVATPTDPTSDQTILLTVDIANKSGRADGFWVDLYLNPSGGKPGPNTRWGTVCDPLTCPGGIAWSIANNPLVFTGTRSLRSVSSLDDPNGYDPANTNWTGNETLSKPGTYTLYAYVDSWHPDQPFGAVQETNENNNVCGPFLLTVNPASTITLESQPNLLPERPGP